MIFFLARLAWRNLWRNRRRTLLTLSAMVLSVAFLILMLSAWEGMMDDTLASVTRTYYGHVQIAREGYFTHPVVWKTVPETLVDSVSGLPEVMAAAPRAEAWGLFVGKDATAAGRLLGVDPARESEVTWLPALIQEGRFPGPGGVALGADLARSLEVGVGDTIGVLGQAADGSILAENLVVTGVFRSGNPLLDRQTALLDLRELQHLLGLQGKVHTVVLRLRDPLKAGVWKDRHTPAIREAGMEAYSWMDFLPAIAYIVRIWRASESLFGMLFYFAVVLVSLNTLYMMFFERVYEFAVWMAMGLGRRNLFGMILLEGVWLAGMASLLGGALGLLLSLILHLHPVDLSRWLEPVRYAGAVIPPRIYAVPNRFSVGLPVVLLFVEAVLLVLFPARRLRHINVPQVIREVRF